MKTKGIGTWICVNHLDPKYKEWSCTLTMNKEEADKLKAVGLKVRKIVTDDDEILLQYKFKRHELNKRTKAPNKKPTCVDAAVQPYDGAVGNGSEVIVKHKPFPWGPNEFGKGISSDFQGLQVVNLVEYIAPDPVEEGDDDDFEVVGEGLDGGEGFTPQVTDDDDSDNEEY